MTIKQWIDRQSPIPLHEQCKEIILSRIKGGELKAGDAIPTEQELVESYGLSRTTVRQAINQLVHQGILQKVRGSGTFVTKTMLPLDLHNFTSFTEDMKARGRAPSSKVLYVGSTRAESAVLKALDTENPVLKIERLRLADGKPMGVHTSYLPGHYRITAERLKRDESLYVIFTRDYHIHLVAADEVLEATAADEHIAELLDVAVGSPVLRIERVSFDDRSRAQEYVVMHYRSDEYKYFVRLNRG